MKDYLFKGLLLPLMLLLLFIPTAESFSQNFEVSNEERQDILNFIDSVASTNLGHSLIIEPPTLGEFQPDGYKISNYLLAAQAGFQLTEFTTREQNCTNCHDLASSGFDPNMKISLLGLPTLQTQWLSGPKSSQSIYQTNRPAQWEYGQWGREYEY